MAKFKAKVNSTKATRKGQKGSKTKLANKIKKKAMKVKGTGKIKADLEAREADLARRVQAYGKFVEQRG